MFFVVMMDEPAPQNKVMAMFPREVNDDGWIIV